MRKIYDWRRVSAVTNTVSSNSCRLCYPRPQKTFGSDPEHTLQPYLTSPSQDLSTEHFLRYCSDEYQAA